MRSLIYLFGGIALWHLAEDQKGIGKIVDGPPSGVTPCLDGRFSTHIPGRGVCSYHGGWKGTALKQQVEETAFFPPGTKVVFTHRWGPYMVGTQAVVSRGKVKYMPMSKEPALPLNFGKNLSGQMIKGTVPISVIKPVNTTAPTSTPEKAKPSLQIIAPKEASLAPTPTTPPDTFEISSFGRKQVIQLPPVPEGIYIEDIEYLTARRAHEGTSHSPEARGKSAVILHRKEFIDLFEHLAKGRTPEQINELKKQWVRFVAIYTKKKTESLHSRSRVMSTNIVGPARFPVRRMEKARNAYENKVGDLVKYWNKFQNRILSDRKIYPERLRTEAIKSGSSSALEDLKAKLTRLQSLHNDTLAMNKIIRKGGDVVANLEAAGYLKDEEDKSRKLFIDKKGKVWLFFTNNTAARLRELKKRIAREERLLSNRENTGERGKRFTGGQVVESHEDNRLRILFEEIPTAEMRNTLKKNGWRWSPKNKAWQRQLTANAWRSANTVLPIIK